MRREFVNFVMTELQRRPTLNFHVLIPEPERRGRAGSFYAATIVLDVCFDARRILVEYVATTLRIETTAPSSAADGCFENTTE